MYKENEMDLESLNRILEEIQGGIILCNYNPLTRASEVVYMNPGWTEITGYTMEQLNAEKDGNPQALVFAEDKDGVDAKYVQQLNFGDTYELMYRITHRNGEIRWVIDKGVTSMLADGCIQNKSIITEVTQIKEREEYMALLAQTDQLTGLNNKVTFTRLAQSAIKRRSERRCALFIMDIDCFKQINDRYGHDFGDKVLAEAAAQMKSFFRSGDLLGRVGGDEFMVLMSDVATKKAVAEKAQALCEAIHGIKIPQRIHDPITVSVGISYGVVGRTYEAMFAEADAALYQAKDGGRNRYCIWGEAEKL